MIVREALVDERAVLPETGEHRVGAVLPVERENPGRRRVDGGGVEHAAEGFRLAGPDAPDRVHAGALAAAAATLTGIGEKLFWAVTA